jgi:ABC-type multidrug transport system ATPase subunit/pSer/pThr/pTyr-binding forkhead associated (FHA) protein
LSGTQYVVRVTLPGGGSQDHPLSTAGLTFGRAPDNDVSLADPLVSGHHARVTLSGSKVVLTDVGSRNGTFVNDQRIPVQSPVPLGPNDVVRVGNTSLSARPAGRQMPAVQRKPSTGSARAASGLVLQVQAPGVVDELSVLKGELSLGRAPDNDVILDSPLASSHHVKLTLAGAGGAYLAMDLGSLNGTRLNGQPLSRRVPTPFGLGDHVQIADMVFALRMATAEAPAPPPLTDQVRVSSQARPGLIVHMAGHQMRHLIPASGATLGRATDSSIVIESPTVSSHHARVETVEGAVWIRDMGSRNGLRFGGQRVQQKMLANGDVLYVGTDVALEFRERLGIQSVEARPAAAAQPTQMLQLSEDTVSIGRSTENAVVLDHPLVSRFHAVIERLGVRQRVTDLKSSNGVYVNGKQIEKQAWLKEGDELRIGPYRLRVGENVLQRMAVEGLRLDALRLQKWVTKEKNLLQDISLSIHAQEFVALVGLSGSGKSTLMDAINGFRPATHGAVLVNNINLYENFDLFRNDMGYVPQQDIVHRELTVYSALDYSAQLRMPADTSPEERHQRILETMEELDLSERKDLPISKLSGGQLKRVSIGVELLTKPRLFFLDEPTSGLDPGTEYNMMRLLRKLADQGRTILLITHATKNVMMCDKVIFLVRGGHVAYYGPPEEALTYFDQFRTDHERRTKDIEFDDIYVLLEDESRGEGEEWADRYGHSSQYMEYVIDRLREREVGAAASGPTGATAAGVRRAVGPKRVSALRQFFILSRRNLRIMAQDRAGLLLMLALAPLMSFMETTGRDAFGPISGDAGKLIMMAFMNAFIAYLIGMLTSVREIVKEVDIYKRERAVNLKIVPYVMSKVWVGFVLAIYTAISFLILRNGLMVGLWPSTVIGAGALGFIAWIAMFVTHFLSSFSGYLMGLTISALSPSQNVAILLAIVFLVPQFLFAGGLMPLDLLGPAGEIASVAISNRWGFEAGLNILRMGKPLVEDPCWDDLPKDGEDGQVGWNDYLNLSEDEKVAAGCLCMGAPIFSGPCSTFPGIMNPDYFTAEGELALVQPEPEQPEQPTPYPTLTPYPTPSPYPTMTPLPTPENPADFDGYMDDMQEQGDEYQEIRQEQGDEYQVVREQQGSEYQDQREGQGDQYQESMETYADDRSEWQRNREQAIGGAEATLKGVFDGQNRAFKGSYVARWVSMLLILLGTVILTVFFQRRKDSV